MKRASTAFVAIACAIWAGCTSTPSSSPAGPTLLPIGVVLALPAVRSFFPAVTRLAQTGLDTTAQGSPTATRSVFYENGSGSKRVTISVDRYGSGGGAASAYATALEKSEEVPGFKLLNVPNLGQRTFAGTVTMHGETHIGLGVLSGNLIVGATLAGFDASPATVSSLVSMTRSELALLGGSAR